MNHRGLDLLLIVLGGSPGEKALGDSWMECLCFARPGQMLFFVSIIINQNIFGVVVFLCVS